MGPASSPPKDLAVGGPNVPLRCVKLLRDPSLHARLPCQLSVGSPTWKEQGLQTCGPSPGEERVRRVVSAQSEPSVPDPQVPALGGHLCLPPPPLRTALPHHLVLRCFSPGLHFIPEIAHEHIDVEIRATQEGAEHNSQAPLAAGTGHLSVLCTLAFFVNVCVRVSCGCCDKWAPTS